ncbi:MAG: hypothetical protein PHP26_11305 [Syntrophomonas sp.]|nr:hypothetical protein [Syntrophomonas sp.]
MKTGNWRQLVEACRTSGMLATEWCRENGIEYRQYVGWATKMNRETRKSQQSQWAEVDITDTCQRQETDEIKMSYGKWTIAVGAGFNPALLMEILKVVNTVC